MFVALISLLPLTSCRQAKQAKSVAEPPVVRVLSVENSLGNASSASYVGTVRSCRSVTVCTNNSGTLQSFSLRSSDRVSAGQQICFVESLTIRSVYEAAQSSLRQAQDGYERLSKAGSSVPEVKMVEVESKLAQARASFAAAESSLAKCKVTAPFSGIVDEVYVTEGCELAPSAPVLRLVDTGSLEIAFQVPEKELVSLREGRAATVEVPALGCSFKAKLKSKGVVASALSHSYECLLVPDRAVDGLLPGMVCKIAMAGESTEAMVIPASAVLTDEGGRYVWTVNDDNRVVKTYIRVNGYSGKGVVVESGLNEGLRVIVDGSRKVSSGMKVRCVI